jgi:hypothetical protein
MPQPLTASGGKWDSPQSIGVNYRNPPQRPNEMSELPTAHEWNRMLLIASERNATTPHRLGEEMGCASEHRNEVSEPLTASR